MTSLLRIPVRFRMDNTAFQCPLNMGLAYDSHVVVSPRQLLAGGVTVPVILRVSEQYE